MVIMSLADELKVLQANSFMMYSQAHGYHWNVEGMLFKELHAFFLEIYEDVYGALDPISENIRKLGEKAPFGPYQWASNATVKVNDSHDIGPVDMVRELTMTNAILVEQLKRVFTVAEQENEQAIANFIADRLDKHQFWNWQLSATLKVTVTS